MVSNQESDKTADNVQPRMLAQTRIYNPYVHSLWLAIALTVTPLTRSAIKSLTELLMVDNQKCWRNY